MIKGMTGFGNAPLSLGKVKGALEIKSQNHRYFDIVFYLPAGFSSIEENIRQNIARKVKRGRVSVSLKITDKPMQKLTFNKEAVREYLKYARILKKEYRLNSDLALSDLIKLPGVVSAKDTILQVEKLWPAINKSLNGATASLMKMREREGRSLAQDISRICTKMKEKTRNIKMRAKRILQDKRKKIADEEFSSFQKSADINEEISRLSHYIDEFKLLLRSKASVGKKLDFIAQEMQRETNTIGAKLQDKLVSGAVIALKSNIEKLREQAQNIE